VIGSSGTKCVLRGILYVLNIFLNIGYNYKLHTSLTGVNFVQIQNSFVTEITE